MFDLPMIFCTNLWTTWPTSWMSMEEILNVVTQTSTTPGAYPFFHRQKGTIPKNINRNPKFHWASHFHHIFYKKTAYVPYVPSFNWQFKGQYIIPSSGELHPVLHPSLLGQSGPHVRPRGARGARGLRPGDRGGAGEGDSDSWKITRGSSGKRCLHVPCSVCFMSCNHIYCIYIYIYIWYIYI